MANPVSWSNEKKRPLILPALQPDLNRGINHSELHRLRAADLENYSRQTEYECGTRILVGLKDYVFDMTAVKESLSPGGDLSVYAFKDISYALAKYSASETDTLIQGYDSLSSEEKGVLDSWVGIFLTRFPVIGMLLPAE
ncbi:hypothetical protein R3P38DRAFT_3292351 [Favolaschia claudopus]